eukprot:13734271-Alexandrium_andersonii.AAC.1
MQGGLHLLGLLPSTSAGGNCCPALPAHQTTAPLGLSAGRTRELGPAVPIFDGPARQNNVRAASAYHQALPRLSVRRHDGTT